MKFQFSKELIVDSEIEPWKSEGIRIGFYSAPGTRKSFTVAACIIEPFLDERGTVVIFEPRSEWHTLKQRYESVLVVGGPFQDIPLAINHAKVYAEAIVKNGVSIVFDFSETDEKDLVRFAAELLARIYTLQNVVRRPLLLFFEEGADYCPFSSRGKLVEPWIYDRMVSRITKIATQGRPLGFMLTMTSQRPAQLNFTVRMMCNLSFYGKFHPKDLNDIKEVLKPYDVPIKQTAEKCVSMPHGHWLAIKGESVEYLTIDAIRKTPHGADTPKLEYEAPQTKETLETLYELTGAITKALEQESQEESEVISLKRKVSGLSKELEEKRAEIKRLTAMTETLGKIKIEAPPPQKQEDITFIDKVRSDTIAECTNRTKAFLKSLKIELEEAFEKEVEHFLGIPREVPKTPSSDLYKIWEQKLPSLCARRVFQFLLERRGAKYTRSQIAVQLGYKNKSGGVWGTAFKFLKDNHLIKTDDQYYWCE